VNLDDAAQFAETEAAFTEMGFSTPETHLILQVYVVLFSLLLCFE